ncbi:MAG: PH domain-containing protein [Pirellulaceae bacterium]|nr:PH domain-containing protein [Pirellulaceae bacterium]
MYDSAVDAWILALLIFTPALAALIGIYFIVIGQPGESMWLFLCGAITVIVTTALTVPCRYTILDDSLSIRSGLLVFRVDLDQIDSIEPSSSWLSGPALSLRRVRIIASKRRYLISPKSRDEFIRDLRKAVKQAKKNQPQSQPA